MKKPIKIVLGIVILAVIWFVAKRFMPQPPPQMPPAMVTLTEVEKKEIVDTRDYVGMVAAKDEVDIVPRVEGYVKKKYFSSGSLVNKGDLLYTLEDTNYLAAYARAKADVENAKALLWESEKNLERAKELVEKDYISKSEYDNKLAIRDKNKAAVEACLAQLKDAKYDLDNTKIYAPVSGKLGSTESEGNLVGPSKGALTTLVRLDPIYVTYNIPADEFTKLRLQMAEAGKDFDNCKVQLKLPDGTVYPLDGKQYSFNNKIDETTGTIKIKSLFSNPKGILLPGQYGTVSVFANKAEEKTVIPQSAVLEDPSGKYVYSVDKENKAEMRRIQAARQVGTEWIIEEGLEPGEQIILTGIQKVRPGAPVMVTPAGGMPQSGGPAGGPPKGHPQGQKKSLLNKIPFLKKGGKPEKEGADVQ